jgi:hypothetical protein
VDFYNFDNSSPFLLINLRRFTIGAQYAVVKFTIPYHPFNAAIIIFKASFTSKLVSLCQFLNEAKHENEANLLMVVHGLFKSAKPENRFSLVKVENEKHKIDPTIIFVCFARHLLHTLHQVARCIGKEKSKQSRIGKQKQLKSVATQFAKKTEKLLSVIALEELKKSVLVSFISF